MCFTTGVLGVELLVDVDCDNRNIMSPSSSLRVPSEGTVIPVIFLLATNLCLFFIIYYFSMMKKNILSVLLETEAALWKRTEYSFHPDGSESIFLHNNGFFKRRRLIIIQRNQCKLPDPELN